MAGQWWNQGLRGQGIARWGEGHWQSRWGDRGLCVKVKGWWGKQGPVGQGKEY